MKERGNYTQLISGFPLSLSSSLIILLTLSFFLTACSVPLYKIAPIPQNSIVIDGKIFKAEGVEISASALVDDDKSFERFESNLPLAGIVAVDIYLKNTSPVSLKPKFSLRDATNQKLSLLDAKNVLKRMMKFEGVRAYVKEGKQLSHDQLSAMALPKRFEIGSQSERRGVLFFRSKTDVMKLTGLRLEVDGLKMPINIPIN